MELVLIATAAVAVGCALMCAVLWNRLNSIEDKVDAAQALATDLSERIENVWSSVALVSKELDETRAFVDEITSREVSIARNVSEMQTHMATVDGKLKAIEQSLGEVLTMAEEDPAKKIDEGFENIMSYQVSLGHGKTTGGEA